MAKLNLNRVPMPKQEPEVRARNFEEVAQGYSAQQALEEASRCIQCPKHPCVTGCPVGVDIPDFIAALQKDNLPEAVRILKSKNSLPGICGRVCPQESQCESVCTLGKQGAPIAIGRLERFVADWDLEQGSVENAPKLTVTQTGKKVAIIGSGPAGLTVSADLVKLGHEVVMYEALHAGGGVLTYGIPEFRLPKHIVQTEIEYIKSLGVKLNLNWVVGRTVTIDELLNDGVDAVFVGTGAGLPTFLNIPGENLNNIVSANAFLTQVNLMRAFLYPEYETSVDIGEYVAVIGGGNVAMDSARCALRLGAKEVYIIYRRSKAELPARKEEVENAEEEGIIFKYLTNPKQFIGDGLGDLVAMECYEMELGQPDASGRRRPVVKPGSEFIIQVDTAIVALGTNPNPLIASTTKDLKTTEEGMIVADMATGLTSKARVWAGGDIITGAATVISAMGAGKKAAASIDAYLKNGKS